MTDGDATTGVSDVVNEATVFEMIAVDDSIGERMADDELGKEVIDETVGMVGVAIT